MTFATDEALTQIISPQVSPEQKFETELVRTKLLLMQLHLTIVKLSMQLAMLLQHGSNDAILSFYQPTIKHLASKLDQIGYLPEDDKLTLQMNLDIIQRSNEQRNKQA